MKTLPGDPDAAAIMRSAIGLGHNLGLKVIAEGVEDPDAEAMLLEAGCDAVQGFLIVKPAPEAEITAVLEGSVSPVPSLRPSPRVGEGSREG